MAEDKNASRTPGNPDKLRARIDEGQTHDKVAMPDPAAAPLGTDAEAAGTPASAASVEKATRQEAAPIQRRSRGFERTAARNYKETPEQRWAVYLIFVGVAVLIALVAIFAVVR